MLTSKAATFFKANGDEIEKELFEPNLVNVKLQFHSFETIFYFLIYEISLGSIQERLCTFD